MDMEETDRRGRRKRSVVVVMACLLATVVVLFAANAVWVPLHDEHEMRPRSGGASSHDHEREESSNNKITGGRRRVNRSGVNETTPPGQLQRLKGSSNQIAVQRGMFAADHRSLLKKVKKVKKTKKVAKLAKKVKKEKATKKKAKTVAASSPRPNDEPKSKSNTSSGKSASSSAFSGNGSKGGSKPSKPGRKPSNNKPKGKPSKPKPKGKPSRPGRKPSNKPKGKPGGGVMGKPKRCSESSSEYKQCCSAWKKPSFYSRCTMLGCRTEDCPRFALSSTATHLDSYISPPNPFDFIGSTSTGDEGAPITAHTGGLLCTSEKQKRCCLGKTGPDFQEHCLDLGCETTACIHHVGRVHLLKKFHHRT